MASELPNPRIGVAAIIYGPDGKIVAGKRKGSHGAGNSLFHTVREGLVDKIQEHGSYLAATWSMARVSPIVRNGKDSKRQDSSSKVSELLL